MTALAAMARAGKVASSDIAGPRGEVRSGPDRVAAFYWVGLVAVPAAGEPFRDFG